MNENNLTLAQILEEIGTLHEEEIDALCNGIEDILRERKRKDEIKQAMIRG